MLIPVWTYTVVLLSLVAPMRMDYHSHKPFGNSSRRYHSVIGEQLFTALRTDGLVKMDAKIDMTPILTKLDSIPVIIGLLESLSQKFDSLENGEARNFRPQFVDLEKHVVSEIVGIKSTISALSKSLLESSPLQLINYRLAKIFELLRVQTQRTDQCDLSMLQQEISKDLHEFAVVTTGNVKQITRLVDQDMAKVEKDLQANALMLQEIYRLVQGLAKPPHRLPGGGECNHCLSTISDIQSTVSKVFKAISSLAAMMHNLPTAFAQSLASKGFGSTGPQGVPSKTIEETVAHIHEIVETMRHDQIKYFASQKKALVSVRKTVTSTTEVMKEQVAMVQNAYIAAARATRAARGLMQCTKNLRNKTHRKSEFVHD